MAAPDALKERRCAAVTGPRKTFAYGKFMEFEKAAQKHLFLGLPCLQNVGLILQRVRLESAKWFLGQPACRDSCRPNRSARTAPPCTLPSIQPVAEQRPGGLLEQGRERSAERCDLFPAPIQS